MIFNQWILSAVMLISAGLLSQALTSEQTQKAAASLGATHLEQVEFAKGSVEVSPAAQKKIADLLQVAKKQGAVEEVKVISWGDTEYPAEGQKAPSQEIKLAEQRAKTLKDILKKSFGVEVDTYNMAERPNALQSLLRTPASEVKNTIEAAGAAPGAHSDKGWFGINEKVSSAVLLIYLKK